MCGFVSQLKLSVCLSGGDRPTPVGNLEPASAGNAQGAPYGPAAYPHNAFPPPTIIPLPTRIITDPEGVCPPEYLRDLRDPRDGAADLSGRSDMG